MRDKAKVKEITISEEKRKQINELLQDKATTDIYKNIKIKLLTGFGPCCICGNAVPKFQVIYPSGTAKVVERYCQHCMDTVFQRIKSEPEDKEELLRKYGLVSGNIYDPVPRL